MFCNWVLYLRLLSSCHEQTFVAQRNFITSKKNKVETPSTANCLDPSENDSQDSCKIDTNVLRLLLPSNAWQADVWYYLAGYIVRQIL